MPKQSSSGDRVRLTKISKQGNRYLRKQLVHGARAAAYRVLQKENATGRLARWVQRTQSTGKHPNKIIVALANKLARIAWCLLTKESRYEA